MYIDIFNTTKNTKLYTLTLPGPKKVGAKSSAAQTGTTNL